MSSRPEKKKACSAARKTRNRPYDNRPRPAQDQAKRRTRSDANAVRVVLPGEPPALNPEAARVLLRILLKAYDRRNGNDTSKGAAS
jgi:hypothetical protein